MDSYAQFLERVREIYYLRSSAGLLSWDQETMMPPKGAPVRAKQLAALSSLRHERLICAEFGELLAELEAQQLSGDEGIIVREMARDHRRAVQMPTRLVQELAETTSLAYDVWTRARKESDFRSFAPWLERVFALKKEEARCLGYDKNMYDAHLDDYEPGLTAEFTEALFSRLRDALTPLVDRVCEAHAAKKPNGWLNSHYPAARQEQFGREIVGAMGLDWEAGRLDVSPHPFCGGAGPSDVRLTTRYNESDFLVSLFSIIHEAGHALYEQGLDGRYFGTPLCDTASLGIHESQSRLWENQVARSADFWEFWFPRFLQIFPEQAGSVGIKDFYPAINRVRRSFIRVDADELTYNLHIILRFELEQAIFRDELAIGDLEAAWNEKMQKYLHIVPPDAARGVLQDVHWSSGLIGYFPTYVLGSIHAAQFFRKACSDLPDLREHIRKGALLPLREWLREKVHRHGRRHPPAELVTQVTGEPPNADYFIQYLHDKFDLN